MESYPKHIVVPLYKGAGFESFYEKNFSKINLTLVFMGVDEETARDFTQEAFTRLWVSWENFEDDSSRIKFLKVVSRNLWIDKYRKIKREDAFIHSIERDFSVQDTVDYQDLLEATKTALQSYDEDKKNMFFEIKLDGVPYKEVAEKFNINVKTLERHMTQMSKSVRSFLKKYYPHISAVAIMLNLF